MLLSVIVLLHYYASLQVVMTFLGTQQLGSETDRVLYMYVH